MSSPRQKPLLSYLYVGLLVIAPALATAYAVWELVNGRASNFNVIFCLVYGALIQLCVTIGYHRMLVHRSFVPHPAIRALFLAGASMAMQGPAISWASVHIKHHAYSDEDGDPHSPTVLGFLHAHFEWMMDMSFDDVNAIRSRFGKRFEQDGMAMFFDKTYHLWTLISLLIPFAAGGWEGLLWGGLVRVFLTSHVTWCVNSWCHVFGGRMFATKDQSRNSMIIGILAMGEGWHNNHHAFPTSAFHGLKWWQVDVSAYVIRILEKLNLASNVVRIPREKMHQRFAESMQAVTAVGKSVQDTVHEVAHSASELASAAMHTAEEVAHNAMHKLDESREAIVHHAEALKESARTTADGIVHDVEQAIRSTDNIARA